MVVMWSAPMDRSSDAAVLAAVAVGDEVATTVFVRRFQRKVYGLALSITLDAATADDVASQAFARAWRHADTYDPRRGAVSTWLLTITRNVAIDTIRVRRPAPLEPDALADLLPPSAAPALDDVATATDQLTRLRRALDRIPDEQRRAVLLATVHSRTSTEIAELEGVPVPTAKHRIQSGLRKLRRAMAADLVIDLEERRP
jgi:RNA polymerase sigma-70 factor (ECF subfamily)